MQPLAGVPDAGGEGLLHKGVHVLGLRVDSQRAGMQVGQNAFQALMDGLHVGGGDDALPAQHGRVDHAAADVLLDHAGIEADAGVKVVDAAVDRFACAALPELRHGGYLLLLVGGTLAGK